MNASSTSSRISTVTCGSSTAASAPGSSRSGKGSSDGVSDAVLLAVEAIRASSCSSTRRRALAALMVRHLFVAIR